MLTYDWQCLVCDETNQRTSKYCTNCGSPSHCTISQIERGRLGSQMNISAVEGSSGRNEPMHPRATWHREEFNSSWIAQHRLEIGIAFGGIAGLLAFVIPPQFRDAMSDLMKAGQLGDFVGGYVGSYLALVSAILLFATLRNQRRATAQQYFEARYFELVKLHRENVAEMKLEKYQGRRIFVLLVRELRAIHTIVLSLALRLKVELSTGESWHISFCCLFYGVGPNSSRMLKKSLASFNSNFIDALEKELSRSDLKEEHRKKLKYVPFEGHQSRLGHYYRHLYQTVHYVHQQSLDIDKYDFVKTIRAQLTTHEQALLLINSLAPFGKPWWKKGLMVKYRMVHNLPREFFDPYSELDLDLLFPKNYFEWEDF